jgi:hypothetical protein
MLFEIGVQQIFFPGQPVIIQIGLPALSDFCLTQSAVYLAEKIWIAGKLSNPFFTVPKLGRIFKAVVKIDKILQREPGNLFLISKVNTKTLPVLVKWIFAHPVD